MKRSKFIKTLVLGTGVIATTGVTLAKPNKLTNKAKIISERLIKAETVYLGNRYIAIQREDVIGIKWSIFTFDSKEEKLECIRMLTHTPRNVGVIESIYGWGNNHCYAAELQSAIEVPEYQSYVTFRYTGPNFVRSPYMVTKNAKCPFDTLYINGEILL